MSGRIQMYLNYGNRLVKLHNSNKNYVEAGLALQLQIAILSWSDNKLDSLSKYPPESESERKIRLMEQAINYFTVGQDYDRAINQSKILANYYQYENYKYAELRELLKDQVRNFINIEDENTLYSHYYRVVFFGKD